MPLHRLLAGSRQANIAVGGELIVVEGRNAAGDRAHLPDDGYQLIPNAEFEDVTIFVVPATAAS